MLVERINLINKFMLFVVLLFPSMATCSQSDWETELLNTLKQMSNGDYVFTLEDVSQFKKNDVLNYVLFQNASMYECNAASPAIILIKTQKLKNINVEDYLWHENRSVRVFTMLLCFYKTESNEPIDTYSGVESYIDTLKPDQKKEAIENKMFIEKNKAELIFLLGKILKRSTDTNKKNDNRK